MGRIGSMGNMGEESKTLAKAQRREGQNGPNGHHGEYWHKENMGSAMKTDCGSGVGWSWPKEFAQACGKKMSRMNGATVAQPGVLYPRKWSLNIPLQTLNNPY